MSRARRRRPAPPPPSAGRSAEVLRRPVITEKATRAGERNQYFFVVAPDATKPEIASAVERLFKVRVESVNTLNRRGKAKRFRGVAGRRASEKKAMVTVRAGQTIDLAGGAR